MKTGNIAFAESVAAAGNKCSVALKPDGVIRTGCNHCQIFPFGNIALPGVVRTARKRGSVAFKPHGVHITRADGGDAAPFGNIALPAAVITDRNDASGTQNAVARVVPGCNVNNARPSFRYALPVIVPAAADNRSVASQPERVVQSAGDLNDIGPRTNAGAVIGRFPGSRNGAVRPQPENEVFPSDSNRTYPAPRDRFAFSAGTRERNGSVKIPQRIKILAARRRGALQHLQDFRNHIR